MYDVHKTFLNSFTFLPANCHIQIQNSFRPHPHTMWMSYVIYLMPYYSQNCQRLTDGRPVGQTEVLKWSDGVIAPRIIASFRPTFVGGRGLIAPGCNVMPLTSIWW